MIIKSFKGNNLIHTRSFQKLAFQDQLFYVLHKTPCENCKVDVKWKIKKIKSYILNYTAEQILLLCLKEIS